MTISNWIALAAIILANAITLIRFYVWVNVKIALINKEQEVMSDAIKIAIEKQTSLMEKINTTLSEHGRTEEHLKNMDSNIRHIFEKLNDYDKNIKEFYLKWNSK